MSLAWSRFVTACSHRSPWKLYNISKSLHTPCVLALKPVSDLPRSHVRWKSRAYGGLDTVESVQLKNYANDVLKELSGRRDPVAKEIKKWRNDLSGILFQFAERKESGNLLGLFDRISKEKHANEASYTIMMRYFADQNDLQQVKHYFEHMEARSVLHHGRSYIPLINVCLKLKEYDMATDYFEKLLEKSRKTYIHSAFIDVIDVCANLVHFNNIKELNLLVDGALHTMEEYGSEPLDSSAIEVINKWFQSDPSNSWSISNVVVHKSGKCPNCETNLQHIFISEERLVRLKRNLMSFVESTIALKRNARIADVDRKRRNKNVRDRIQRQSDHYEFYDTLITGEKDMLREIASTKRSFLSNPEIFSVLGRLEKFLDENGPFDVVIDALNIGYYTKGFNPHQVRDVVEEFKDKNCLVLCAGILKEKLLTQEPVPRANVRLKHLLTYLEEQCKIFFAGSSVLDDYYILYTILYHDFNIQLVSRDLFRDHLFHLDAENKVDFQRWQKANQFILKSFTDDNKPVFSEMSKLKVAVQHNNNGWHFPMSRDQWLCVRKSNS